MKRKLKILQLHFKENGKKSKSKQKKTTVTKLITVLPIISTTSKCPRMPYKRRLVLHNMAKACDRSGLSDINASLLLNAVPNDSGIVSNENPSL